MDTAAHALNAQPLIMRLPATFAALYERYFVTAYRTALRVTGNPADAEDAMQTVFLRILKLGGQLDAEQLRDAYFKRAATNAALDLLRRRTSHAETTLKEDFPAAGTESAAFLKERLRRALAALPEDDAELFLLRFVEGFSNGELAEMFGLEKNNIAVRLHRIRQVLQAEMER